MKAEADKAEADNTNRVCFQYSIVMPYNSKFG